MWAHACRRLASPFICVIAGSILVWALDLMRCQMQETKAVGKHQWTRADFGAAARSLPNVCDGDVNSFMSLVHYKRDPVEFVICSPRLLRRLV